MDAGFGWNNMPRDLGHGRKRPYPSPQIACRICDQVFMSTQALINHIESHMIEDEAFSRRQHEINLMMSQRHHLLLSNPSPYQRSFAMDPTSLRRPIQSSGFMNPQALHERNPFSVPTTTPNPRILMPSSIHSQLRPRRASVMLGAQLPPGCSNVSQMLQLMNTVDPAASTYIPPICTQKPPTFNVRDVVRPQVVRNQQDHNMNTSDDKETVDLTLKL